MILCVFDFVYTSIVSYLFFSRLLLIIKQQLILKAKQICHIKNNHRYDNDLNNNHILLTMALRLMILSVVSLISTTIMCTCLFTLPYHDNASNRSYTVYSTVCLDTFVQSLVIVLYYSFSYDLYFNLCAICHKVCYAFCYHYAQNFVTVNANFYQKEYDSHMNSISKEDNKTVDDVELTPRVSNDTLNNY